MCEKQNANSTGHGVFDDFEITKRYAIRLIDSMKRLKNVCTKPYFAMPSDVEALPLVEIRCLVIGDIDTFGMSGGDLPDGAMVSRIAAALPLDEYEDICEKFSKRKLFGEPSGMYEVKYKIVCPHGYWGDNRKKFIAGIQAELENEN